MMTHPAGNVEQQTLGEQCVPTRTPSHFQTNTTNHPTTKPLLSCIPNLGGPATGTHPSCRCFQGTHTNSAQHKDTRQPDPNLPTDSQQLPCLCPPCEQLLLQLLQPLSAGAATTAAAKAATSRLQPIQCSYITPANMPAGELLLLLSGCCSPSS